MEISTKRSGANLGEVAVAPSQQEAQHVEVLQPRPSRLGPQQSVAEARLGRPVSSEASELGRLALFLGRAPLGVVAQMAAERADTLEGAREFAMQYCSVPEKDACGEEFTNLVISCNGRLLLEKQPDKDFWTFEDCQRAVEGGLPLSELPELASEYRKKLERIAIDKRLEAVAEGVLPLSEALEGMTAKDSKGGFQAYEMTVEDHAKLAELRYARLARISPELSERVRQSPRDAKGSSSLDLGTLTPRASKALLDMNEADWRTVRETFGSRIASVVLPSFPAGSGDVTAEVIRAMRKGMPELREISAEVRRYDSKADDIVVELAPAGDVVGHDDRSLVLRARVRPEEGARGVVFPKVPHGMEIALEGKRPAGLIFEYTRTGTWGARFGPSRLVGEGERQQWVCTKNILDKVSSGQLSLSDVPEEVLRGNEEEFAIAAVDENTRKLEAWLNEPGRAGVSWNVALGIEALANGLPLGRAKAKVVADFLWNKYSAAGEWRDVGEGRLPGFKETVMKDAEDAAVEALRTGGSTNTAVRDVFKEALAREAAVALRHADAKGAASGAAASGASAAAARDGKVDAHVAPAARDSKAVEAELSVWLEPRPFSKRIKEDAIALYRAEVTRGMAPKEAMLNAGANATVSHMWSGIEPRFAQKVEPGARAAQSEQLRREATDAARAALALNQSTGTAVQKVFRRWGL